MALLPHSHLSLTIERPSKKGLTALITPAVGFYYPEVDLGMVAFSVIINNTLFPVVLAAPFIILVQEELGFKPLGYRLDDNPRPALQS